MWITGASSGYGRELARAFGAAGAKLVLSARRCDRLAELAATLPRAQVVPLDLGESQTFDRACQDAVAAFGGIDIVIHNGAIGQSSPALDTRPEVARQIMEIDYFSYTELTRSLLPHFLARRSGHIVVVSGLLARITLPGRSSYAAAKAALFGYFGCLRAELVSHNIDVTVLVPGAMQTGFATKALTGDGTVRGGERPAYGCAVEEAARQSLDAIARREVETYIGDADGAKQWTSSLQDPVGTIERIVAQARARSPD